MPSPASAAFPRRARLGRLQAGGWPTVVRPVLLTILALGMGLGYRESAVAQQAPNSPAPLTILRPGDLVRITVWPDSSLSGEFPVEETGYVYLPGLGQRLVSGRSISDIRRELREEYGRFMSSPVVTVTPLFPVSVLGAVGRPGLYRVDPTMTVFDVISLAGGLSDRADIGDVRLIRRNGQFSLDAEAALEGGGDGLSLGLQSGDRIVVGQGGRIEFTNVLLLLQISLSLAAILVR